MSQIRSVVAVLAMVWTACAHAEPSQYLCLADQSAGLSYDKSNKGWHAQAFIPDRRFILRRVKDDDLTGLIGMSVAQALGHHYQEETGTPKGETDLHLWVAFDFGAPPGSYPRGACVEWLKDHLFDCHGIGAGAFSFDYASQRFGMADIGGYIDGSDLVLMVGTCSPF
jgi:hypothetical protein